MKIYDLSASFFRLWWYNTAMKESNTALSPIPNPNVQVILSDMLAKATRNLEIQRERQRQFEIKREREMVMKAKRDAENKCRNILQGH
jgi:hypothetical protein